MPKDKSQLLARIETFLARRDEGTGQWPDVTDTQMRETQRLFEAILDYRYPCDAYDRTVVEVTLTNTRRQRTQVITVPSYPVTSAPVDAAEALENMLSLANAISAVTDLGKRLSDELREATRSYQAGNSKRDNRARDVEAARLLIDTNQIDAAEAKIAEMLDTYAPLQRHQKDDPSSRQVPEDIGSLLDALGDVLPEDRVKPVVERLTALMEPLPALVGVMVGDKGSSAFGQNSGDVYREFRLARLAVGNNVIRDLIRQMNIMSEEDRVLRRRAKRAEPVG